MCLNVMRWRNIIRASLFVIFFGIGAAALSVSILCDDLLEYYRNKQFLKTAEESLRKLESLNADYDALLGRLKKDPNLVKRLGPATLGTRPADTNTIYPKATAEQLAAARKILTEDSNQPAAKPATPRWLARCSEPTRRAVLFLAGAFLILISFIWFGSVRTKVEQY